MINIICVGKIKEEYLSLMINDYCKRVNKYHKVNIIELKDSNIKDEGDLILKNIKSGSYVVAMDILGENLDSKSLSKSIDNWLAKYANVTFIIGGSDGIDERVKEVCNYKLSFGKNTFPHGVFRAILLEQIYRSFKILNNETYHK